MTADRLLAFRVGAGILIVGALVHVITSWPAVRPLVKVLEAIPGAAWLPVAGFAVSALTAVLACGLALLLLWKAAERADARMLTLFLACLAIFWGSLFRFINVTAEEDRVSASLSYGGGWVSRSATLAFVFATAAFVRFSALFPRPLTADRLRPARRFHTLRRIRAGLLRGRTVWGLAIAAVVVVEIAPMIVARITRVQETQNPPLTAFGVGVIGAAVVTYVLLPIGAFVLGTMNLRASYRIASEEERRRILWVVSGFSAAAWLILGALGLLLAIALLDVELRALGAAIPLAIFLAPLVLVTCAAIGILRSGAIDSALVLRRSTVYGALGALGVVAFAGLENALSALVEERLALPGFIGSIIAGAAVTAALIPVRQPVRRFVTWYAQKLKASESPTKPQQDAQIGVVSEPSPPDTISS